MRWRQRCLVGRTIRRWQGGISPPGREDQEYVVLLACSSLITVVEDRWYNSRAVQISHFSVKDFLTSDRLAASRGDSILASSLRKWSWRKLVSLDYPIDQETIKSFPLAKYAAEHFNIHAEFERVLSHIQDGVDHLFDGEKPHFAAWL